MATPNDLQRVWQHMLDEFFPGEPCIRLIGNFKEENVRSTGTKLLTWAMKNLLIKDCLKDNTSVLALNNKDEIVGKYLDYYISRFSGLTKICIFSGFKLGQAVAITDKKDPDIPYTTLLKHLSKMMSNATIKFMHLCDALHNTLRYDPHMAMEDQGIKKIFVGEVLSVAASQRGMKLGMVMMMQSMEIAREKECEGYFAVLSGIYSQKIYEDLGFSWMKELVYADFKDKAGNIILDDMREHKSMITAYKKS